MKRLPYILAQPAKVNRGLFSAGLRTRVNANILAYTCCVCRDSLSRVFRLWRKSDGSGRFGDRREVAAGGAAGAFRTHQGPARALAGALPLPEVLLVVVCGSVADCNDDAIAAWGKAHLDFPRHFLRYYNGVPGGHWPADELDRSGDVPGQLHRLGARDLARAARTGRHRRQDVEAQPRPDVRQGGAAHRLRLRHRRPGARLADG